MSHLNMFKNPNQWDTHAIKYFKTVEQIQKQLRRGNKGYLAKHPEVRAIIRVFIAEVVKQQPNNVHDFAAQLFSCINAPELVCKINEQLKKIREIMKKSHWCEHDGDMLFSEVESSHSLVSADSVSTDVNQLLTLAMLQKKSE